MDGTGVPSVADVASGVTPFVATRRTVQLPIELDPHVHRRLMNWCRVTASELDVPGLARADVLEALIEHLVLDAGASRAVRDRLAQRLNQERRLGQEQGGEPPVPRPPRDDRR